MSRLLDTAALLALHERQLAAWPEVKDRYEALSSVQERSIAVGDVDVRVQYNPARITSTAAHVDKATLEHRPCFLCEANRPKEQMRLDWRGYSVLVNPFPILPHHFTIATQRHQPQHILNRIGDMVDLARLLPGLVVFYNGPMCGASAPDHAHFQAGDKEGFPLLYWLEMNDHLPYPVFTLQSAEQFLRLFNRLPRQLTHYEPMVNVLAWSDGHGLHLAVIPRIKHRPSFYGTGAGQMLISPASIDLSGLFITPRREDYMSLDAQKLQQIYTELCFSPQKARLIANSL